jgi:uncharacterized protein (TIGR02996 family)
MQPPRSDLPFDALLPELVAAWQADRQPEVADLVDGLTRSLLAASPRPALPASKRAADLAAWREVEARRDLLDFPRLMAAARGGSQEDVARQVTALRAWDHPGLAAGLLTLLEKPPNAGIKSRPMLEVVHAALEATGDVRLVEPARALAARYLAIVNSSTGGWIVDELDRIATAVSKRVVAPIAEDARRVHSLIAGRLPAEHRVAWRALTTTGPSMEALLALVYADPDADAPRLVAADALLARGDARGELIQLQIARATGTQTPEQAAREAELAAAGALASWARPLSSSGLCSFERGFPHAIALYKTAAQSLGAPEWATIRKVEGLAKLSTKGALELLDHPSLANVREVAELTAAVFAKLGDAPRPWTAVTVSTPSTLESASLARFPSLRRLKLTLTGDPAKAAPDLLAGLTELETLDLRAHGEGGEAPTQLPATVRSANVHLSLRPGAFRHAKALRELTFWTDTLTRPLLEGLEHLERLDTQAERFDGDAFAPLGSLRELKISLDNSHARNAKTIPVELLQPLRCLAALDVSYERLTTAHLEALSELVELTHHWMNVADVPRLPQLRRFHCMAPARAADLQIVVERCPALRELELCWNSGSDLWFSSELEKRSARAWAELTELLNGSALEVFGFDEGVRMLRDASGAWSRLSMRGARNDLSSVRRLALHLVGAFPIRAVDDLPPWLEREVRSALATRG